MREFLEAVLYLACTGTPWEKVEVGWYGGRRKPILVFSRTSLWRRRDQYPVAIRYVLGRDPEDEQPDAAYLRLIRSRIWQARISDMSEGNDDVIELPRCYFEAIVQGFSTAA